MPVKPKPVKLEVGSLIFFRLSDGGLAAIVVDQIDGDDAFGRMEASTVKAHVNTIPTPKVRASLSHCRQLWHGGFKTTFQPRSMAYCELPCELV